MQEVGRQLAVETGAVHGNYSLNLRGAQNHVLEAGLVLGVGVHEQRAADLQGVGVELAVETGALHVDEAFDFGAVENHRTLEGCAIAQEQIALGMQTVGDELAVHQRANEQDQAVCSRATQIDRTFDPGAEDIDWPNELRVFKIDIPQSGRP